jgi:WD40 repeat protein
MYCVEFSPDESKIYAGTRDGRIIEMPAESESVDEFIDPTVTTSRVVLSPTMNLILIDDSDPYMKLVQPSPMRRSTLELPSDFGTATFSPDGSQVVASHDGTIWSISTANRAEPPRELGKLADNLTSMTVLMGGKLFVRDQKQALHIIDPSDRSKDSVLWDLPGVVAERMAASPDGRLVAASMTDKKIRCWNLESGATTVMDVPEMVRALAFGYDGRRLAVGCLHGLILVLDLESKEWVERLTSAENVDVKSTIFADRDQTILAATSEGGLQFWDLAANEMIYSIDNDLRIEDIQYSVAHDTIAVCGQDEGGRGILRLHRLKETRGR